jgi:hypothetical protein
MDGFFLFTAVPPTPIYRYFCKFSQNINILIEYIVFININLDNLNIIYYYSWHSAKDS